eukprot:1345350-Amorphochlora_amoeboformis.AAC.1
MICKLGWYLFGSDGPTRSSSVHRPVLLPIIPQQRRGPPPSMISTYTRLSPILILVGFMIFHQIFSRGTKPSLSSPSICRTPSLQSATRKPFQHLAGRKTFPRIYRTYSMVDHTEYSPETLSGEEKGFAEHIPVSRHVIESLEERGIRFPTPIQAASMERIYEGENAILHAETGSVIFV